jgi:hypothetical protein
VAVNFILEGGVRAQARVDAREVFVGRGGNVDCVGGQGASALRGEVMNVLSIR